MAWSANTRAAVVIAGIACCAAAASCNGRDSDATRRASLVAYDGDTTDTVELEVESDTAPQMPLVKTGNDTVITARKTPPLPKLIDSMTNKEVGDYVRSLAYKPGQFNIQVETVPCVHQDSTPCTGSDSAHVRIQPEAGMNKRPLGSIPKTGLIVARIINDSPIGHDAAEFYYPAQSKTWWVVDDSGGTLRSRYFTRTYLDTGRAIRFVTRSRSFGKCGHPDAPAGRAARAKFWDCPQSEADTTLGFRSTPERMHVGAREQLEWSDSYFHLVSLRSSVPLPAAPPYALVSNWVTCGAGCCASQ